MSDFIFQNKTATSLGTENTNEKRGKALSDQRGSMQRKSLSAATSGSGNPDNHGGRLADHRATSVVQRNNTGLPDQLKSGVESLSGMSLDHVKVHYNSSEPAQLNAHAYAQGSDIHLAPGQEKHLPHEAWHVVQQAQGRVRPTTQMKAGVAINDDDGLEKEADVMGARALGAVQKQEMKAATGAQYQFKQSPFSQAQATQLFAIGMVPATPANWRHYTTSNANGGAGGAHPFTDAQKDTVRNNNRANAAGVAPVLVDPGGGFPASDSTQGALMTAAQANSFAPQVDHIVESTHYGANDLENARLLSQGENNGAIGLGLGRPAKAQQRMRAYEDLTIAAVGAGAPAYVTHAAGLINQYQILNLNQINALSRHAGANNPGGYAGLSDGILGQIGAAQPGVGPTGDVSVT